MYGLSGRRNSMKDTILVATALFMACLLGSATRTYGMEMSAEQKEVWDVLKESWELRKNGETDIEKYETHFHKDLFYWGWNLMVPLNKKAWAEMCTTRTHLKSLELMPMEINILENMAIVMYKYSYVNLLDNDISAKVLNIYEKENGKWRLLSGMSSSCQKQSRCP
jgi:hypothetical protein